MNFVILTVTRPYISTPGGRGGCLQTHLRIATHSGRIPSDSPSSGERHWRRVRQRTHAITPLASDTSHHHIITTSQRHRRRARQFTRSRAHQHPATAPSLRHRTLAPRPRVRVRASTRAASAPPAPPRCACGARLTRARAHHVPSRARRASPSRAAPRSASFTSPRARARSAATSWWRYAAARSCGWSDCPTA